MAPYTNIAVFGATGKVGQEITRALVDGGFNVVPLSRQRTTVAGIPTQEIKHLGEFDVVVSTVGLEGKTAQLQLIQRARADGVKRFVASEYGVHPDTDAGRSDLFANKREMRKLLEEASFPDGWTAIASGFFDNVLPVLVHADPQSSVITIRGNGQTRHPFTLRSDIGRVLAHTFREPHRYKNRWLTVVNVWHSLTEVAEMVSKESGQSWTVEKAATDMKLPILHLAEKNGWDILPSGSTAADSPVELSDFDEIVIPKLVKLA